jgi:hypothetical protein
LKECSGGPTLLTVGVVYSYFSYSGNDFIKLQLLRDCKENVEGIVS